MIARAAILFSAWLLKKTRPRDYVYHLPLTWHNVGHGLQKDGDKMPHVVKLWLWQIKDLIGCIKVKVPRAMGQRGLISGQWRNWDRLGQQQKHGRELGAFFEQLHHLATEQKNCSVLRGQVVQSGWDEFPVIVLLDRRLYSWEGHLLSLH